MKTLVKWMVAMQHILDAANSRSCRHRPAGENLNDTP